MADDATLSLYDTDFYLWTQAQTERLRARLFDRWLPSLTWDEIMGEAENDPIDQDFPLTNLSG